MKVRYPSTSNRQKRYANDWYNPIEFQVGDNVFLRVLRTRGLMRIEKKVKLNPKFVDPYELRERNGEVDYCL